MRNENFRIFSFVRDFNVSISDEKTFTKAKKTHENKEFNLPV